jgi:hypothetical protein
MSIVCLASTPLVSVHPLLVLVCISIHCISSSGPTWSHYTSRFSASGVIRVPERILDSSGIVQLATHYRVLGSTGCSHLHYYTTTLA